MQFLNFADSNTNLIITVLKKSDEVKKKGMCQNFDTPPYALFNESFYFDLLTMS